MSSSATQSVRGSQTDFVYFLFLVIGFYVDGSSFTALVSVSGSFLFRDFVEDFNRSCSSVLYELSNTDGVGTDDVNISISRFVVQFFIISSSAS